MIVPAQYSAVASVATTSVPFTTLAGVPSDHIATEANRVLGRIYVAGVFIAGPLGVYIQYFEERLAESRSFTIAEMVDAALLMGTTGIALAFILKGKVEQHRQWMTRSFAVALVFLGGRVVGGVTAWENLDNHIDETIVWACLAFSILSADLVLQFQELRLQPYALSNKQLGERDHKTSLSVLTVWSANGKLTTYSDELRVARHSPCVEVGCA